MKYFIMSDSSGKSWRDSAADIIDEWVPDSAVEVGNDLEDLVFKETGMSTLGEAIVQDIDRIDWEKPYEENSVRVVRLMTFLNPVFKRAVFEWSKSNKKKGRQLNEYWGQPSELSRFLKTDVEREMFKRFVEMTSKGDETYFRAWNAHAVAMIGEVIEDGAGDLGLVDSLKDGLGLDLDDETLQERARAEFIRKERIFVGLDQNAKFESIEAESEHYSEVLTDAFFQLAKKSPANKEFTLDEFFVSLSAFVSDEGVDKQALEALKRVRKEDAAELLAFMNTLLLDARIDLKSVSKEAEDSDEEVLDRELDRFGPGLSSFLMILGFVGLAGVIRHKVRKWKGKESSTMFAWLSGAASLASFGALAGQEQILGAMKKNGTHVSAKSFAEASVKAAQFDFKGAREALFDNSKDPFVVSSAKRIGVRAEVFANYKDSSYGDLLDAEGSISSGIEGAIVDGVEAAGVDTESLWVNMIPGMNQLQFVEGREKIVEFLRAALNTSDIDVADAKKMKVGELIKRLKPREGKD